MAFLQEEKVHIARQVMSIHTELPFDMDYLKYFLATFVETLKAATKSMIPGISREDILDIMLPLPPLAEQHRIATRIQELLPNIYNYNSVEEQLSALNNTFPDRLKKSILQYAAQGKLVPQDTTDEPASVLLERIRAEKEQLIIAGKTKNDKH